ncbi:hypothetical protein [Nitrospira sp. Kam-Ns4a]
MLVLVPVLGLSLAGCGFASFVRLSMNDQIKPEDVSFIEPGRTTLREIVTRLGPPHEIEAVGDGMVARYHFRDVKYSRLNLGWPARFFLPVTPDMILAGGGLGTDVFQVRFDSDWVALEQAFARHADSSRYKPWPFARGGVP